MPEQPGHIATLLRAMRRDPSLFAWAVQIFLIPIYIFRSGLPQPGDMFIVILVPSALLRWDGRLSPRARAVVRPLMWFTAWAMTVNYSWAILTGNFAVSGPDSYLLYPVYYIFNVFVFLIAFVLYRRHGDAFLRLTVYAIMATVFLQVAVSFVFRAAIGRGTLFFNNPNQLGYYALLSATLVSLVHRRLKFKLINSGIALTACAYLALISASRAATGGVLILLVLVLVSNPRIILAACVATAGLVAIGGPVTDAIDASQQRVLHHNDNHLSFAEERGYDRIWTHREYLILGAGEGGLSRFDTATGLMTEIHSSAGTIVFSYGLLGTIAFVMFGWRVVKRAPLRMKVMLLPPLLYAIAHQGLRFTMLWVVLAVFVALKDEVQAPPRAVARRS